MSFFYQFKKLILKPDFGINYLRMKNYLKFSNSKKIAAGLLSAGIAGTSFGQTNELPNIVLVFTDDQGYGDLGCFGSENILTPTIDSLAENGVKFTNFYVSQAVSSASRASLLTGCYPNRIGITGALTPNSEKGIAASELTLAEMLKEQGYATGIFGKWHLGDQEKFLPLQHGFDEYVGWPYSNDMWPVTYGNKPKINSKYPKLRLIEGNKKTKVFERIEDQDSITTILTRKAVDFINRKASEPFFLYFPHPMPHVPLGVSEKFADKSKYGKYGDVIMEIDWSVKQLVEALKKNGIADNTLIIFTSDNGPWKNFGDHGGTTAGLREGKGTSWEGGHKVPCVMNWHGKIPKGLVINNLASTLDILPTLAEISDGKLPNHTIDGQSILPYLFGDTSKNIRDEFCYYYNENELQAVRKGDWKLGFPHVYRSYTNVEPGKNGLPGKYNFLESGLELYNLKSDPFELNNVIDEFPKERKQLQILAEKYRQELGDFLTGIEGKGLREPDYNYEMETNISHLAVGAKVQLFTQYNKKYSGRGAQGLTDGKIGRPAFKDRSWQAYYGNNLEAIIHFDKEQSFDTVIVSTLKNEGSWIFLPKEIVVSFSTDGENFEVLEKITSDKFQSVNGNVKYHAKISKPARAKSIKVEAINIGKCPKGHIAEGKPAWMFFDEIIVK